MGLPKIIGPIYPSGSELKGIIYEIKQKYGITDPIKSNIVLASSNGNNENTHDVVVLWNKNSWQSKAAENPWVQLDFPKNYIRPTAYSMRGVKPNDQRCFATKWDVFGICEGDEKYSAKWIKLASNSSSETDFCKITIQNACFDIRVGTYNIGQIKSNKRFKHIRFVLTDTCNNPACVGTNNHNFATSGIDVYGTLYASSRPNSFRCSQKGSTIIAVLFILINIK